MRASCQEQAQPAGARFLAVSAARNDTPYRIDSSDCNAYVRELRAERFGKRSVSNDAKHKTGPR
jgi:hypothetical protein